MEQGDERAARGTEHSGAVNVEKNSSDPEALVESLKIRNAFLEHLLDSAPDAIIWAEPDHRVFRVNPSFSGLFGYAPEEVLGRNVDDVIAPKEFYNEAQSITRRVSGGEAVRSEVTRCRKDGSLIFVDLMVAPIRVGAQRVGVCASYRDITERKRAEEERSRMEKQLLQAQKMEAIGALAAGVAHDFNNLLMGVQGNASLVLADLEKNHPHHERLSNIEQYVRMGAELTKQMLGFAKGGRHEVRPANLNDLIDRSAALFIRTKKEITLHTNFQEDLWPVQIDLGQVEQVLLNLYINAWQSMPRGGTLAVSTRNVMMDQDTGSSLNLPLGKYVKFSIVDTGIGMDKSTQDRIFEPFFSTKKMGRGIGLGLASVYAIIKNHGGAIEVESRLGEGTRFSVYFPATESQVNQSEVSPTEMVTGAGTILLVDDEEMILQVGGEILERIGYRVLSAKGGRKAVELFEKCTQPVDLVILDMIMPEMSGAEVFYRLREINPSVKVLLSSGYSMEGQARELLKKGCIGFIQKPYSMGDLSKKVKDAMERTG
jgi:two-component system, cell cycle sensor histidine kinase and response regulator CckA